MNGLHREQQTESLRIFTLKEIVRRTSQEHAFKVLKFHGWDRKAAAARLKISPATLYRLMIGLEVQKKVRVKTNRYSESKNAGSKNENLVPLAIEYATLSGLVKFFGSTVKLTRSHRNIKESQLLDLFYDCRRGYIEMAKRFHPDSAGPDGATRMRDINLAWARLKKMLRKHKIEC